MVGGGQVLVKTNSDEILSVTGPTHTVILEFTITVFSSKPNIH